MERSLAYARARGWKPWVVEKWIARVKQRLDAYHMIDLLILDGERGVLGVQVCGGSDLAAHRKKLLACDYLEPWLSCGARLELWSWRKLKARRKDGKPSKRFVWKLAREPITLGLRADEAGDVGGGAGDREGAGLAADGGLPEGDARAAS